RAWSGLGYNRRARDLHAIAGLHPQSLPEAIEDLDALPGVGAYTAGAVACFAHGVAVAFADTHVRRVLGRAIFGRAATGPDTVAELRRLIGDPRVPHLVAALADERIVETFGHRVRLPE